MLKLEPKPPKLNLSELGSPAQQGKVVYALRCRTCHGEELTGQPPVVPSLINAIPHFGVEHIRRILQRGAPPMPAFADLPSAEVDALIAFLTDPQAAQGSKMSQAWASSGIDNSKTASEPERYWSGYGYMRSSDGLSEISPPWTTLTAFDLDRGVIKWQIPVGEVSTLMAKGVRNTGSATRGGVVVTAGGVIFAGTQDDRKFRAYDKDTGKQLWETEIPARPNGVPSVFDVGGREYVVICATEALAPTADPGKSLLAAPRKTTAQGYYVFALPPSRGSAKGGLR